MDSISITDQPLDLSKKKDHSPRTANDGFIVDMGTHIAEEIPAPYKLEQVEPLNLTLKSGGSSAHSSELMDWNTPLDLCYQSTSPGQAHCSEPLDLSPVYYPSPTKSHTTVQEGPLMGGLGVSQPQIDHTGILLAQSHCLPVGAAESISRRCSSDGELPSTSASKCSADSTTTNDQLTCSLCGIEFLNQQTLTLHVQTHGKIYQCQMCKREYKQARDYRAHMATHTNSTNLQCDMCPQVLSNTDEYLNHLKTHGQKDLHICEQCGRYFRDKCTLRIHMRTHTGEKPFQCSICRKTFRQSGTFKRHMRIHQEKGAQSS